jgi:hypothetical protein
MITLLVGMLLAMGQSPDAGRGADDVAAVKALYASAAYEEALSRVTDPATKGDGAQLAQYRALCLLALGRGDEAERTFGTLILQRPLYVLPESEFSPKIVSTFHAIRKRVLPDAARALYAHAKADYDDKNFQAAVDEFHALQSVLTDADMAGQDKAFADLKTLADGFLGLATSAVASTPKPAPVTASPPASTSAASTTRAPEKPPAPPAEPTIFSAADKDVTPPVQVSGRMPDWNPTSQLWKTNIFRGVLEIVVDERGTVQSAIMRQQVPEHYDERLIAATKDWHFKPAQKNGTAVPYKTFLQVVLQPKGN